MGTCSIYSFPENNQHADYRLVNPHDTLKQGAWVSAAFTPEFSLVFATRPERAEAPSPGRMAKTCENSGVNAPGTHVPYFRASCGLIF